MRVISDVLLTFNLSKEVSVFVLPTLTDFDFGPTVHRVAGTTCISMVPTAHMKGIRDRLTLYCVAFSYARDKKTVKCSTFERKDIRRGCREADKKI